MCPGPEAREQKVVTFDEVAKQHPSQGRVRSPSVGKSDVNNLGKSEQLDCR